MKTKSSHRTLTSAVVLVALTTAGSSADWISQAIENGKVSLAVRSRYEGAQQSGLLDANAVTFGTNFGFTSGLVNGFQFSIETENTTALDGDKYNQAGLNPGGTNRAVVADPEGSEFNQAWVTYNTGDSALKLGRQNLVLDNARFIGNVGWRQNAQTFDAFTVQNTSVENLKLTYSYLAHINRIFGDDHPQGDWKSDSHLFNVSYTAMPVGILTGYAYLLDFDNATANSTATYGASLTGAVPVGENKLIYRAEYAWQADYGSSTLDYSTDYLLGEVGFAANPVTIVGGYELLGTDNGVGFKTPLATLHAFNGWTDIFLGTPGGGLRDVYGKVVAPLPSGLNLLGFYHQFDTDTGAELGEEIDVQVVHKFSDRLTGLLKFASFDPDSTATLPDVEKLWVQFEFKY